MKLTEALSYNSTRIKRPKTFEIAIKIGLFVDASTNDEVILSVEDVLAEDWEVRIDEWRSKFQKEGPR